MIEILIVAGLLALLLGVGITHFRNSRSAAVSMAGNLSAHMDLQRSCDILSEALIDGTEVIKPAAGSSMGILLVRDLVNYTTMFYLEREPTSSVNSATPTYALYSFTDTYGTTAAPNPKKRLFKGVRRLLFTTLSPGLVQVHLTLLDAGGKELSALMELPLKNVSAINE